MTITAIDPHTALVLIDLQRGILEAPTQPCAAADVLDRAVRPAEGFRRAGTSSPTSSPGTPAISS